MQNGDTKAKCAYEGCERVATCKGACDRHYRIEQQAIKRATGICKRCSQPVVPGLVMCETHRQIQNLRHQKRKAAGKCMWCTKPQKEGHVLCERHLKVSKERQDKRMAAGKCRDCANPAAPGKTICESCLATLRNRAAAKRKKSRVDGVCNNCGKPNRDAQDNCKDCRDVLSRKRLALKIETLNAYGGCWCLCCGEREIAFLTLEHPNCDGKAHRQAISNGSTSFYRKLKKLGFPKDVEMVVNCFNCNVSKASNNGVCAHEVARQKTQNHSADRLPSDGMLMMG